MDANELRNMTDVELAAKAAEIRTKLRETEFAGATQGAAKASAARGLRRTLARILTVAREKSSQIV